MDGIDAIQLSRKSLLKKGQQKKKVAENKKRQRGFDGTTDELEAARESFRKPSKILRTTGPVASSSAMQIDTPGPVASSSVMQLDTPGPVASSSAMQLDTEATDAPESASDVPVPEHPADDNEEEDDEDNWRNIQRMYSLACVQRPDYTIEELDEMVEWSQPKEADDPDASTSAAFTRYGLMLSVLEPIEADARFEAKLLVCHRYICVEPCLPFCARPTTGCISAICAREITPMQNPRTTNPVTISRGTRKSTPIYLRPLTNIII